MRELVENKVLSVDDDSKILKLVGMVIQMSGLTPELSQDPYGAIEWYRENADQTPVVITDRDYGMPINGDKFAAMIREIAENHIPPLNPTIIMISGDDPRAIQEAAPKVDIVISKPFSPAVLRAEIVKGRDRFNFKG